MPTILPMIAPRHNEGINKPQGTLMPNVKIVMTSLRIIAKINNQMAL